MCHGNCYIEAPPSKRTYSINWPFITVTELWVWVQTETQQQGSMVNDTNTTVSCFGYYWQSVSFFQRQNTQTNFSSSWNKKYSKGLRTINLPNAFGFQALLPGKQGWFILTNDRIENLVTVPFNFFLLKPLSRMHPRKVVPIEKKTRSGKCGGFRHCGLRLD